MAWHSHTTLSCLGTDSDSALPPRWRSTMQWYSPGRPTLSKANTPNNPIIFTWANSPSGGRTKSWIQRSWHPQNLHPPTGSPSQMGSSEAAKTAAVWRTVSGRVLSWGVEEMLKRLPQSVPQSPEHQPQHLGVARYGSSSLAKQAQEHVQKEQMHHKGSDKTREARASTSPTAGRAFTSHLHGHIYLRRRTSPEQDFRLYFCPYLNHLKLKWQCFILAIKKILCQCEEIFEKE